MSCRARLLAALAACAATLACAAAPAAADIAPPWELTSPSAGTLAAEPAGDGSTLAITVTRPSAGLVRFSPAPVVTPASGCNAPAPGGVSIDCTGASLATALQLDGDVVEVDVSGIATALLRIDGGAEADAITVAGPLPPSPETIAKLELLTGAGPDAVTASGRISQITDAAGSDTSDDRYTLLSTSITVASTISPQGGDDIVRTADPDLGVLGGQGNDTLLGPGALNGEQGNDTLKPTTATQTVVGGSGSDRISYEALSPVTGLLLERQPTGDLLVDGAVTQTGVEAVEGGPGDDTLIGTDPGVGPGAPDGVDVLAGGLGDDTLRGRGAADDLDGGPGRDTVSYVEAGGGVVVDLGLGSGGTAGAVDTLHSVQNVIGSAGADSVTGSAADEAFDLGPGDDAVSAGAGNDVVAAGSGNDLLRGGSGTDILDGGADADTALYDERSAGEPVSVSLATLGDDGAAGENDTLAAIENVAGGAGNDVLSGDDGANALTGNGGNDTINGLDGADVLRGGEGRDIVSGDLGGDMLLGEGGDDSLLAFDGVADTLDCGDGADDDAQVDGLDRADNCEFRRRLDVLPPADLDGDGVIEGTDCNDRNAAIRPGAPDPPADGIDQDCDGRDTALPVLDPGFRFGFDRPSRRGTKITVLELSKLPAGSQVVISCRTTAQFPRRCPFGRVTRKLTGTSTALKLSSLFKNRTLPVGTRIELRISAANFVTKLRRYTVRRTSKPRQQDFCLPPGESTPGACPAGSAS